MVDNVSGRESNLAVLLFVQCAQCLLPFGGKNWGENCENSMMGSNTFNLKPEYQGQSLFQALGWEGMSLDSLVSPSHSYLDSSESPETEGDHRWKDGTLTTKGQNGSSDSSSNGGVDGAGNYSSTLNHKLDIPISEIFPNLNHHSADGHNEELATREFLRLASLNTTTSSGERDFSKYFITPLNPEEIKYLQYHEHRFRARDRLFKDILRNFG